MIYVDTSVTLAHLLVEDRRPPNSLWNDALISSRLLEYEVWTRLHARGLAPTHSDAAHELISQVSLVELAPPVLERALDAFPVPVRTLDALHLASLQFLQAQGVALELASYDHRMVGAAEAMGVPILELA